MYLPPELLPEILSRLDVRSLLRFKTVCKSWHSLIEDRTFIRKHMNKSSDLWVFGPIVDTYDRYEFGDSYFGLILEHNYETEYSRIRNPSTGKILELPNPGLHTPKHMKMCHIQSTGALKLAVPCQYETIPWPRVETGVFFVLTVGIDITWRMIDIPYLRVVNADVESTAMVGEDYFMLCDTSCNGTSLHLIRLEMGNERISMIEIPNGFFLDYSCPTPLAWGEGLALVNVKGDDEEVHIWVMEDHKKVRWTEKEIIVPLNFADPCSKELIFFWKYEDNGLVINFDDKEFLLLDIPSGKMKWRYLAPEGQEFAYYHVPSLQHPKGDETKHEYF